MIIYAYGPTEPKGQLMPSGGKRTPGPGKRLGRPRQHPAGQPRPRKTEPKQISLYPDEWKAFDELLGELGGNGEPMARSEFVRRVIPAGWVLKLSDEQLAILRVVVKSPELMAALAALAKGGAQ